MKSLFFISLLFTLATTPIGAQQANNGIPKVRLGNIQGNHMEGDKVIRPQISASEILVNPVLVVDSPGWKVVEYKCSMLSSEKQYWGPFVIGNANLDIRIIDHIKSAEFKKGRMFLENIRIENNGRKTVTNNIIIDYSN